MKTTLLSLLAAAVPALAIPPTEFGFPTAPNNTAMSVAYTFAGNTTVVQEAQLFGSNITSLQPMLAVDIRMYQSIASYPGRYLVIMVDPDAPSPDQPTRRSILHWLATNASQVPATSGPLSGQHLLVPDNTSIVIPYAPPAPPPTSAAHRYMFYTWRQPSNFMVPASWLGFSATNRSMFDVDRFVRDTGLGSPAAAQYYYVSRQPSVPGTFIALAGGQFPGGNGAAVFPSGSSSGNGSTTGTTGPGPSGTNTPTNGASGLSVGLGGVFAAGFIGLSALL